LEAALSFLNIPEYNYCNDCSSNRPTIAKDGDKGAHGLQSYVNKGEAEAVGPVEERQGNYGEKDQLYEWVRHGGMNSFKIERIVARQSKRYQDTRYDDQDGKHHSCYHAAG